jgi:1,4-alpha-glucan branching enzyme
MHTELMILNAYPKLDFMGAIFGEWSTKEVALIRQRYTDLQQLQEHRRRKELQQQASRRSRFQPSSDDDDDDDGSSSGGKPGKPGKQLMFDD